MGKKGGGKKGGKKGKGKKGPEDWGTMQREKFVVLEVRNSVWQSMRFSELTSTAAKLSSLVQLIIDRHNVAGLANLSLYLGDTVDESTRVRPEEYGLTLADIKVEGGSANDRKLQVLTYEYGPHKTEGGRGNYGILSVPQGLRMPALRP